jgi:hypothetical protein
VVVAIAAGAFIGILTFQPGLVGMAEIMEGMNHFGDASHRVHDLTYGLLFTTGIVGLLAQLRRPSHSVAGMSMALVPWAGLVLAAILSTDSRVILSAERLLVAALTIVVVLLHPAGLDFFQSFRVPRFNWMMLALVAIAAVPLIGFASANISLQGAVDPVSDSHAALGHYGFMAAFSFTTIGVGALASLRPDGWRLTAWVTGLLPTLIAITSVVYPNASSSLSIGWVVAATAWGAVFIAVAELTKNDESPSLNRSSSRLSRSTF